MCLEHASLVMIAEEDITCYKIMLPYLRLLPPAAHGVRAHVYWDDHCIVGNLTHESHVGYGYGLITESWGLITESKAVADNKVTSPKQIGSMFSIIYLDTNVTSVIVDGKECLNKEVWITPYRGMIVEKNIVYKSDLELHTSPYDTSIMAVHKGLHSYIKVDMPYNSEILFECTIPKGSKYYVGKFCGTGAYASDHLIYKRVLDYNDFV